MPAASARVARLGAPSSDLISLRGISVNKRSGNESQHQVRKIPLSFLVFALGAGCGHPFVKTDQTTISVAPGDIGSIEFAIENQGEKGSNRRMEEAWLSTAAVHGSGQISVTSISVKETGATSPITIEPGDVRTFVIAYHVDERVSEGTFQLSIDVRMLNAFTDPPPEALGSTVIFHIRKKTSS